MSRFLVETLMAGGPARVIRRPAHDERGQFARLFCVDDLADAGWAGPVAQINLSVTTRRGTVRGIHFQRPPCAEVKLVVCLEGAVWDVAVDVRAAAPAPFAHVGAELSAANGAAMLIPAGFAHGFQSLTEDARLLYVHSAPYAPLAEDGLNPFDPAIGIAWPLPVALVSDRDAGRTMIDATFQGVAA